MIPLCAVYLKLTLQRFIQAESEGLENEIPGEWKAKSSNHIIAVLRIDKTDSKSKTVKRDEGHCILIKAQYRKKL